MNREQQLQRLAERLRAACAAGDWPAVADADRALGAGWRRLSALGPWRPAERAALDALQHAHRDTTALCGRELDRVRQRLNELADHKDGWMAYALGGDWEGDTP